MLTLLFLFKSLKKKLYFIIILYWVNHLRYLIFFYINIIYFNDDKYSLIIFIEYNTINNILSILLKIIIHYNNLYFKSLI